MRLREEWKARRTNAVLEDEEKSYLLQNTKSFHQNEVCAAAYSVARRLLKRTWPMSVKTTIMMYESLDISDSLDLVVDFCDGRTMYNLVQVVGVCVKEAIHRAMMRCIKYNLWSWKSVHGTTRLENIALKVCEVVEAYPVPTHDVQPSPEEMGYIDSQSTYLYSVKENEKIDFHYNIPSANNGTQLAETGCALKMGADQWFVKECWANRTMTTAELLYEKKYIFHKPVSVPSEKDTQRTRMQSYRLAKKQRREAEKEAITLAKKSHKHHFIKSFNSLLERCRVKGVDKSNHLEVSTAQIMSLYNSTHECMSMKYNVVIGDNKYTVPVNISGFS